METGITAGSRPDQLSLNSGRPTRSNPLLPNKDGWEKNSDARRWRRFIDDRRRWIINRFPVGIGPIVAIRTINSLVVFMPMSLVIVIVLVMFSMFMVIFGESRGHVYTADHCS